MTDRDRQNQALVSLCNALSRCTQEQVDLTDVIRHFYAWTVFQKREQKAPVVKYVRLTADSPLPEIEIGSKVRIEDNYTHCDHKAIIGNVYTVVDNDGFGFYVVNEHNQRCLLWREEVSLVIEE